MANFLKFLPNIFGIGEKIVEGISKNAEMKKQIQQSGIDLEKLKTQIDLEIVKMVLDQKNKFRNFILDFEGKANELPKGLLWLRSSFRPVASYFFLIMIMIYFVLKYFFNKTLPLDNQFWNLAMIIFGFFFAERSGSRIVEQIKK